MFVLFMIVGVLNYIATVNHLYWSIYEFDSLVHFLAGAALSMFFLWLYFFSGFFNSQNRSLAKFLLIAVLGSMFMAVSWEIYELVLGEAVFHKVEYPFDTTLDIIMGFLGAIAACFYGYLKNEQS